MTHVMIPVSELLKVEQLRLELYKQYCLKDALSENWLYGNPHIPQFSIMTEITKPLWHIVNRRWTEVDTNPWKSVAEHGYPQNEEVVLIHVRSLEEHGYLSAWWCDHNEGGNNWCGLDDAVTYEDSDVLFYRESIGGPDYEDL
jgi:hypothetical protein